MFLRLAACLALASVSPGAATQVKLSPCTIDGVQGEARCGTYRVFEDRQSNSGRTIDLNIVVLGATGKTREPDPLFVIQGGPGQGVAQLADFYGRLFAQVRLARDIVLVDLRGTGKSNLLACPQLAQPDANAHFDEALLSPGAVASCRASLEARADLTKYTTEIALADLDEVRAALGYERINIYGTSYGTYAAQLYLRLYPARVRTIAMKGAVPLRQLAPLSHARDGETAWQALVARCAADAKCQAAFPALDRDMRNILERLRTKPQTLTVKSAAGRPVTIALSAGLFGEVLRNMLYTPESQARVPALIRQAAGGDFSAVGPLALRTRTLLGGAELSAGFFLSVTCAEGVRQVDDATVRAATARTFAGDYRLRQQMRACAEWPMFSTFKPDGGFTSDVPVLVLSGELDPVTPPARGDEVLQHFRNGVHVVAANNGHSFGKLEGCGNLLIARMIESGTTAGLDASCARALPPVPFER